MRSIYDGCEKHRYGSSNFDPHCGDCWDEVARAQEKEDGESYSGRVELDETLYDTLPFYRELKAAWERSRKRIKKNNLT